MIQLVTPIAVALLLLVLQATLLPALLGEQPPLDMPLIFVVYLGLTRGPTAGAIGGFTLGLLFDAMSRGLLGLGAFAKTLVGYLVGAISRGLLMESLAARLLTLALITVAHESVVLVLGSVFEVLDVSMGELARRVLLVSALNCAVAFVLYRLFDLLPMGQASTGAGADGP